MGTYYLIGCWRGMDLASLLIYRPAGDLDAFPATRQFGEGQFGDAYTAGKIGEGWIGFPCASMLPHGLFLRFFGAPGFVCADILASCFYYTLLARLLICTGARPAIAFIGSLFATLRGFTSLAQLLVFIFGYHLHSIPFYLDFLQSGGLRFPRPLISDIYLIGAMTGWLRLARQGTLTPSLVWTESAAWMAALFQGDLYSFVALSIAFAGLGTILVATNSFPVKNWSWLQAMSAVGTFLILSSPFLIQRWNVHVYVVERFGVFTVQRQHALELAVRAFQFFPAKYLFISMAFPWLAWAVARWLRQSHVLSTRFAIALSLIQVAGYVALPAFIMVTGRAVQLYHFRDAAHGILCIVVTASFALIGTTCFNLLSRVRRQNKMWVQLAALTVGVAGAGGMLIPIRLNATSYLDHAGTPLAIGSPIAPWAATYHRDFQLLTHELSRHEFAHDRILATVDRVVYSWWCGLRGGQSFLANAFGSTLAEREMLQRLIGFGRLNQLTPEQFIMWLTTKGDNSPHGVWLSNNLYGANRFHAFSAIEDYAEDDRRKIISITDPLDCWFVAVPLSEQERFRRAYEAALQAPRGVDPMPDLLLLTHEFPQLRPDPNFFVLVYENNTFRVFRRQTSP